MYRTDCGTAHSVLLNRLSKVNTSCGLAIKTTYPLFSPWVFPSWWWGWHPLWSTAYMWYELYVVLDMPQGDEGILISILIAASLPLYHQLHPVKKLL